MATSNRLRIIVTARDTADRLTEQPATAMATPGAPLPNAIHVDPGVQFQEIEGFGGAFTEAAATTLQKLPPAMQQELITAYFHPVHGNAYSLCRTHINSCDFSLGNYAYDEVDGDVELKHFTLERDRRALIPMIQAARRAANGALKLFASPWSPPAWMKTNGQMNRGGQLKPEYRAVWARYFARYIREYAAEGIPVWGVTTQNEPAATQSWDSCIYSAEEERDFIRDHLGPTLAREGLGGVKIILWDHNRDWMVERAIAAYNDPAASRYIWGIGFHWYCDDKFDNVQFVHDAWPDKKLIFTEGCQEGGPHTGEWGLGERYARSMVQDLNHWTVAWVDWNLLLDERGGPNHVNNLCSAPILADTATGKLMPQNSYYYIGHFSRFIRPGARRVLCASTRDMLETTGFLNPDGSLAVVVLNRTDVALPFTMFCKGQATTTTSLAHSIMTLVVSP